MAQRVCAKNLRAQCASQVLSTWALNGERWRRAARDRRMHYWGGVVSEALRPRNRIWSRLRSLVRWRPDFGAGVPPGPGVVQAGSPDHNGHIRLPWNRVSERDILLDTWRFFGNFSGIGVLLTGSVAWGAGFGVLLAISRDSPQTANGSAPSPCATVPFGNWRTRCRFGRVFPAF